MGKHTGLPPADGPGIRLEVYALKTTSYTVTQDLTEHVGLYPSTDYQGAQ